jgi:peptide/nickel transport system ATP-binding protein
VSLTIERGKTLGLVGESGCGKSVTAQSIMRIVPPPGKIVQGKILFTRQRDGNAMEAILLHRTKDQKEARAIALDMLTKVGIPNPKQRIDEYPHQLSGGMRQRAMIAMALSCTPSLLIADEPTTALDVTVQAQVIELMMGLRQELGMSMLYITHDLGVIAEIADEVAVMYLGKVIERGTAVDIFYHPYHPYTKALLQSVPHMGHRGEGKRLQAIRGTVPIPINMRDRCGFRTRCQEYDAGVCMSADPPLLEVESGHWARCYRYQSIKTAQ